MGHYQQQAGFNSQCCLCSLLVLRLEQISKLLAPKKKATKSRPWKKAAARNADAVLLLSAGGWMGREAKEMRVYFMLSLLFGAVPEYSALREEGEIIFAPKKTQPVLPGKAPLRFEK